MWSIKNRHKCIKHMNAIHKYQASENTENVFWKSTFRVPGLGSWVPTSGSWVSGPTFGLGPRSQVSPLRSRVPESHLWDEFRISGRGSHQQSRVSGPTFRICRCKLVVKLRSFYWQETAHWINNLKIILEEVSRKTMCLCFSDCTEKMPDKNVWLPGSNMLKQTANIASM